MGVPSKLPLPSALSPLHVIVADPVMWNPALHVATHCPFQAVGSSQLSLPSVIVGASQVIAGYRKYNLITSFSCAFKLCIEHERRKEL